MIRIILFAFLLAVPIAEIAVFLAVGSQIGVLPTLAIIVLTAILGTVLLRRQGLSAFAKLQADIREKRVPTAAIGHAITVAVAGVLLLTPGFITDTVGFLLFIPAVRRTLWRQISGSVTVKRFGSGAGHGRTGRADGHPRVIDLDATEVGGGDGSSPWRGDPR